MAIVAAIFLVSAIAGFMILPLIQPNANATGLWDAICSTAGVVKTPTSAAPIEPPFKVSSAVMTPDMWRTADPEAIGRGATLAHQCAICHGPTGVSRALGRKAGVRAAPKKRGYQARRRNVALDRRLERPADDRFELGDRLDRLAPLDFHQPRGLLREDFIGGRLAFLTAGRIAAVAGLELGVRGRPAIADLVLQRRRAALRG